MRKKPLHPIVMLLALGLCARPVSAQDEPERADPPAAVPTPEKLEEPARGPHVPIAVTSFAVAGVSLVNAIITGSLSLVRAGDLKDDCGADNVCDTEAQRADLATATAMANASNASFAIAGVGTVVGLVVLLAAPSDTKKVVAIRPVGNVGAALELAF